MLAGQALPDATEVLAQIDDHGGDATPGGVPFQHAIATTSRKLRTVSAAAQKRCISCA
jgi:hypothetical protein